MSNETILQRVLTATGGVCNLFKGQGKLLSGLEKGRITREVNLVMDKMDRVGGSLKVCLQYSNPSMVKYMHTGSFTLSVKVKGNKLNTLGSALQRGCPRVQGSKEAVEVKKGVGGGGAVARSF